MFNAKSKDRIICALEIINKFNHREYDLERQLRDLSKEGALSCLECGQPVILKAGYKRLPHFAHKSLESNCTETDTIDTSEHMAGILYLYDYIQKNLPQVSLYVDYPFMRGRKANLYVDGSSPLAIEYINKPQDYQYWEEKHLDYLKSGVKVLWLINAKYHHEIDPAMYNFFGKTISRQQDNQLILVDVDKQTFIVTKYFEFAVEDAVFKRKKISITVPMDETSFTIRDGIVFDSIEVELKNAEDMFLLHSRREYQYKLVEEEREAKRLKKYTSSQSYGLDQENRKKKLSDADDAIQTRDTLRHNSGKSQETYLEEAFEAMKASPDGPWYDSRGKMSNPWLICSHCGELTNDIAIKDNNKYGICRECSKAL